MKAQLQKEGGNGDKEKGKRRRRGRRRRKEEGEGEGEKWRIAAKAYSDLVILAQVDETVARLIDRLRK